MSVSFRVDAKNYKSFAKNLKTSLNSLKVPFKNFDRYVVDKKERSFKNEIDPSGRKWASLAPSTLAQKKTRFKLRETFTMYRSFFTTITNKKYEYGFKDPKYRFHHFGTTKMPRRRVIDFETERPQINQFIIGYLRTIRPKRKPRT